MAGYGLRRIGGLSTDPLPSKTRTFSELVLPILAGCYLIFLEGFFLEQAQRDRFQNEKDYAVVSRGQPKKKKKRPGRPRLEHGSHAVPQRVTDGRVFSTN